MTERLKLTLTSENGIPKLTSSSEDWSIEIHEPEEVYVSLQTELKMCQEMSFPDYEDPEFKTKFGEYMAKSREIKVYYELALLITNGDDILADDLLMNNRGKFFKQKIVELYTVAKEHSNGATNISQLVEEEYLFFSEIARFRTNGNFEEAKNLMKDRNKFFREDPIINLYCLTRKYFKDLLINNN